MKLSNAQIFDLAHSLEELMEKQLPVKLAFKLSRIFQTLEDHRKSIARVIEKLPRDEEGRPETESFCELLAIEIEVSIQPVEPDELFQAFNTITPKQALALLPIMKGGEE